MFNDIRRLYDNLDMCSNLIKPDYKYNNLMDKTNEKEIEKEYYRNPDICEYELSYINDN